MLRKKKLVFLSVLNEKFNYNLINLFFIVYTGVPRLSLIDSWDRLQQGQKMDGWMIFIVNKFYNVQ